MKSTDHFKEVIKNHLDQRAAEDVLFARTYSNPEKNLNDCITYILNEVKKSKCNGFADDEIYSMAIHYYDEADIQAGDPIRSKIVVNHVAELTDEEKRAAKQEVIQQYKDNVLANMRSEKQRSQKKLERQKPADVEQLELF